MADYGPAAQYGPLGKWNPPARKRVSIVLLTIAVVLLVAGAAVYFLAPASAATILWIAFVVLAAVLLLELAVLFSGLSVEGSAPAWIGRMFGSGAATSAAGPAAIEPAMDRYPPVDLKCPECENVFTARDTGERPLRTTCPHCGAEGLVDLPAPEPAAAPDPSYPAPAASSARQNPSITLRCPACATQFSTEDDGTRPLRTVCPGCGRSGRLR